MFLDGSKWDPMWVESRARYLLDLKGLLLITSYRFCFLIGGSKRDLLQVTNSWF